MWSRTSITGYDTALDSSQHHLIFGSTDQYKEEIMPGTQRQKTTRRATGAKRATGRSSIRKTGTRTKARPAGPKWINSPAEHEDRSGQSLATKNHEVIQKWAEERNARPVSVPGTERGPSAAGVLRLDFPGYGGSELQEISWDEWFEDFDSRDITFVFQEHLKNGNKSNFFKLVK